MPDIPNSDTDFSLYAANVVTYVNANLAKWGLVAADMVPVDDAYADWNTKLATHSTLQTQAKAATQAKDDSRYLKPTGLEPQLRALRNRIGAHPNCDNADRLALGLSVPGDPGAPPSPPSHPDPNVQRIERLEVTIGWRDSVSGRKGKPAGVKEADIWFAITDQGTPVPPVESFAFLARDTATPYTMEFDSTQAGKVAHFNLRWVYETGQFGPWSPTISVTVVG